MYKYYKTDYKSSSICECENRSLLRACDPMQQFVTGTQGPKAQAEGQVDPRSVAHKINISALDISPGQSYAQLVSNIYSLLSLCQ
jgi:hypothetical protein